MPPRSKSVTPSDFKNVLNYDSATGIFTWKSDIGYKIKKGSIAGTTKPSGYRAITFRGKHYLEHRLAWFFIYGYCPENQLDHIDRDKLNNKIANLRETSQSCNIRNTGVSKNNSSGIKGVYWNKSNSLWKAQICIDSVHAFLGYHKDISEAAKARWEAEKEHGYPNCCSDSSAYKYLKENNLLP